MGGRPKVYDVYVGNVGFSECQKNPTPCAPKGGPHEIYRRVGALASFSNGRNAAFEMLENTFFAEMFLVPGVEIISHYSGNLHPVFFLKKNIEIFLSLQDLRLFLLKIEQVMTQILQAPIADDAEEGRGLRREEDGRGYILMRLLIDGPRISQVRTIQSHFTTLNC